MTPFGRAPTQFTLISFWTNSELNFVDVALYLVPRQGLREQIGSIINFSHFLEVQVTLCCFLLDPQVIGASICPTLVGPRWRELRSHRPRPIHSWVCRGLCTLVSPIVSADAVTKPYNSAPTELRATTTPHFDEIRSSNCVSHCGAAACSFATCPIRV